LALKYSQWPGSPSVPFGARKACPKAVSVSVWVRSEHDFAAEFRLALADPAAVAGGADEPAPPLQPAIGSSIARISRIDP
jgi:hypothetical protein